MAAKKIMVQGAGYTSVGKSFIVALFCELFKEDGHEVAPFKTLNFTPVTYCKDGREFGYSQALQAIAAGQKPDYRMNPLTLKPLGNGKINIILEGKCIEKYDLVRAFAEGKIVHMSKKARKRIREVAKKNLESLSKEYDIICIEGAGPAKFPIPEMEFHVANMGTASIADAPVLLVTDNLNAVPGVLSYMKEEEKERIKGVILNKLRIDEFLKLGVKKSYIKPVIGMFKSVYQRDAKIEILGFIPYFPELTALPELDSIVPSPKIPFDDWKEVIANIAEEAREYIDLDRIYEIML